MQDNSAFDDLVAALDGRQMTDDEGQVEETTSTGDTTAEEQITEAEPAPAEKPAEPSEPAPKADEDDSENTLAEDESGKQYVPKKRFDKIYGKQKDLERKVEAYEALLQNMPQQEPEAPKAKPKTSTEPQQEQGPSKADFLELKMTLPQFDPKPDEYGNPTNPDYSPTLDALGYRIWKANPSMSLVEAGREAMRYAKEFSKVQTDAQTEARRVKSLSSDQGITSRVQNRTDNSAPGANASLEEMEAYLKSTGEWDRF